MTPAAQVYALLLSDSEIKMAYKSRFQRDTSKGLRVTVVTSSRLEYYDIINVFGYIFSQRTQSFQLFVRFSYLLLYSFRLSPPIWGPCAAARSAPWLIRPCYHVSRPMSLFDKYQLDTYVPFKAGGLANRRTTSWLFVFGGGYSVYQVLPKSA